MKTAIEYLASLSSTPPDAIQRAGLAAKKAKSSGREVYNLGIGVAQDECGKDIVLSAFTQAEERVRKNRENKAGYILPVTGYLSRMNELIFCGDTELYEGRTHLLNAHGGTNGDYLALLFWQKLLGESMVFVYEDGAWPNYDNIVNWLAPAGTSQVRQKYILADQELRPTLGGLEEALVALKREKRIPVIIMQNGPQNGLGIHRDESWWNSFLDVVEKNNAVVHFDDPYAGMSANKEELESLGVLGAMQRDWYPLRKAAQMNIPFTFSSSMSKIGGQYGKRIAVEGINVPADSSIDIDAVASTQNLLARAVNSFTSETHLIVDEVLTDTVLFDLWLDELGEKVFANIQRGREALMRNTKDAKLHDMLQRTRGMFVTLPMSHNNADSLANADPAIVLVKGQSLTLSPDQKKPCPVVRLNVMGIVKEKEDEIAQTVMRAVDVV